jgi:hypothetical protein
MDCLFGNVKDLLHSIVDSGLKYDQSYSVGMMVQIEYYVREYEKTCHKFILQILDSLLRRTALVLEKFVVFAR